MNGIYNRESRHVKSISIHLYLLNLAYDSNNNRSIKVWIKSSSAKAWKVNVRLRDFFYRGPQTGVFTGKVKIKNLQIPWLHLSLVQSCRYTIEESRVTVHYSIMSFIKTIIIWDIYGIYTPWINGCNVLECGRKSWYCDLHIRNACELFEARPADLSTEGDFLMNLMMNPFFGKFNLLWFCW